MFNKLKQFKDLRNQAKKLQEELAQETVDGTGARGMVTVTINGNQEVLSVTISPELVENGADKVADAVKDATNDAISKIQKVMAKKMQSIAGGLPGLGM
jgi:DNA-binding YbaB/EbfC family protein